MIIVSFARSTPKRKRPRPSPAGSIVDMSGDGFLRSRRQTPCHLVLDALVLQYRTPLSSLVPRISRGDSLANCLGTASGTGSPSQSRATSWAATQPAFWPLGRSFAPNLACTSALCARPGGPICDAGGRWRIAPSAFVSSRNVCCSIGCDMRSFLVPVLRIKVPVRQIRRPRGFHLLIKTAAG